MGILAIVRHGIVASVQGWSSCRRVCEVHKSTLMLAISPPTGRLPRSFAANHDDRGDETVGVSWLSPITAAFGLMPTLSDVLRRTNSIPRGILPTLGERQAKKQEAKDADASSS
jgi:hypothetical protein